MPRIKRRGHKQSDRQYGGLTCAELVRLLVDSLPGAEAALLAHLPEQDRADIKGEADALFYAERWERRKTTLQARLETWSVGGWQAIFCEMPELERELTPKQRDQWNAFLAGAQHEREVSTKVLQMPRRVDVKLPEREPGPAA